MSTGWVPKECLHVGCQKSVFKLGAKRVSIGGIQRILKFGCQKSVYRLGAKRVFYCCVENWVERSLTLGEKKISIVGCQKSV